MNQGIHQPRSIRHRIIAENELLTQVPRLKEPLFCIGRGIIVCKRDSLHIIIKYQRHDTEKKHKNNIHHLELFIFLLISNPIKEIERERGIILNHKEDIICNATSVALFYVPIPTESY